MKTEDRDEFFIGYASPMPPRLARFVARIVAALACGIFVWGAVVGIGHAPLEGGTFEFGHPHRFAGTVVERPYPALQIDAADRRETPLLLLVAPGKHGAESLVRGLDGRRVSLTGTRARRDVHTMIEVEPASLVVGAESPGPSPKAEPIGGGPVRVRGEIVDAKCFLGVMVPGSGKTHKDCASLCVRGGIPPALYVEDPAGHSAVLLLVGPSGDPIGAPAIEAAGEAVDVTGTPERRGGWLVLRTDPRTWQPVAR